MTSAARVVLVTTDGSGSMDLCGDRLAEHLRVERLHADIGSRSAELFGVPLLGPRAAHALRADARFVARLRRDPPDLWHFVNHHTARHGPLARAPYVVSVYDLIRQHDASRRAGFISRPNARDRLMLRLDAAGTRRAAAICAPSRATKRDLVTHLGIAPERVAVVHLGVDHGRFRPVEGRPLAAPYLLYVGSEHPRKNLVTLLRAFAALRRDRRHRELRLVKVGEAGKAEAPFRSATRRAVDELGLGGHVVFAGRSPDAELPRWYSHAECLVHPSLAEGFGLTVVEAMACGCPVVVSTAGSLPEIAGDGAVAVAPRDVAALRGAIAGLLGDAAARAELSQRGRTRAACFSWRRTARETELVYAAALGSLGVAPGDIESSAAPAPPPATTAR